MAGRRISEWDVLNRFLALMIGSHRKGAWSLGPARQAAFDGVWDDLVAERVDAAGRVVTDSNMHTSCVYEVGVKHDLLHVSTVLPFFAVWDAAERRYLDRCPAWADGVRSAGFAHMGDRAARTLSPYRDEEAERRLTYAELLFEWTEGSDGLPDDVLVDPWNPGVPTGW